MKLTKTTAPIAVLVGALVLTGLMFTARPSVEPVAAEVSLPVVEAAPVTPGTAKPWIATQGTVEPRTESDLVAEVAGRIVWVSPQLATGSFFADDETLVRVDPRDYEIALEAARAKLARSQSDAVHARAALERQRSMRSSGASSRARLDDAVHVAAVAEAGLREARVAVERAELDLARTEIRAPFEGRVRAKHIDVGQFIGRGSPVARLYAVDYAEVRLPVRDEDAAFLELPQHRRPVHRAAAEIEPGAGAAADAADAPEAAEAPVRGPAVRLSARVGGRLERWDGHVVRTEGALDPRTRMITVVARVDDPYALAEEPGRAELPVGLFVDAEIEGRAVRDVIELPRPALREREESVIVVGAEDRLRLRRVDLLRVEPDRVWIRGGLEAGERVVRTPLDVFVEGMKVRLASIAPRERRR